MRRRPAVLVAVVICLATGHAAAASTTPSDGRYGMDRPFVVHTHSYAFGQAPTYSPDGKSVVFHADYGNNQQVYVARLDGSHRRCVTCAQAGPNMVAQYRPQGDKILYHSWQGHNVRVGAPGFGGLGSDIWVVDPDGRNPVDLTPDADGHDNYHAYWSPDGTRLVWAHLNWNFVTDNGRGYWDVRVADYVAKPKPHLANVRVVRPANGHYYETQWWAPDGRGFLYTESFGNAENLQLFYCRLTPSGCEVRQLTDDPSWDEQAIFTPDGQSVIFMSARGKPSLWNTWANVSWSADLPTTADYLLILPLFEAGFLQPVGEASTDLYQLDLETMATRRLTHDGDDGWITPEFTWDPTGHTLMWTESRYLTGVRTPLPFDPVAQAGGIAGLLAHPPALPDPATLGGPGPNFLLEARTRLGTFDYPARHENFLLE